MIWVVTKRVLAVEEVVNARYGVIEQWALLLRNAWPKVSTVCKIFKDQEPFYGTICLYNRERREKLSEDFYFSFLPTEMQDTNKVSSEPRGLFYLDAPSASVCLLIQLEKPATEEGGVTPSVYSLAIPSGFLMMRKMHLEMETLMEIRISMLVM
ncbi:hypothetical protein SLEP1_g46328 [Rubroshorea leprosula]|uniref:Uncharacterized protein n=1 Tax=Rubroshorea leprosula TaxID=152421 RepID=A0AAV5LMQ3_9ROSI|nr:hypothetical protein SLEP1_g46328 [Rubroshorea leprosula]